MKSHLLFNRNKRFAFTFLILLCKTFGYYWFWSSKTTNFHTEKLKALEYDVACFEYRLSNKNKIEIERYVKTYNSSFVDDFIKMESEKECKKIIKENDLNKEVEKRQKDVEQEIKKWIISHLFVRGY